MYLRRPVRIVGGGVSGLSLALALHRAGAQDVAVYEAQPAQRRASAWRHSQGITLSRPAVAFLDALDIGATLEKRGQLLRVGEVERRAWGDARLIGASATAGDANVAHGALLDALSEALHNTRSRVDFVDVHADTAITRCEASDIDVAFSGEGSPWRQFGQPLVGADGAQSDVRRALFTTIGGEEEMPVSTQLYLWGGRTPGIFSDNDASPTATNALCATGVTVFPTASAVLVLRRIGADAYWSLAGGVGCVAAITLRAAQLPDFATSHGPGDHLSVDGRDLPMDSIARLLATTMAVTPLLVADALSDLGIDARLAHIVRNTAPPFACLPLYRRGVKLSSFAHRASTILVGDAAHPVVPLFSRPMSLALCDADACARKLATATTMLPHEWVAYYSMRRDDAAKAAAAADTACALISSGDDLGVENAAAQRFFAENPP